MKTKSIIYLSLIKLKHFHIIFVIIFGVIHKTIKMRNKVTKGVILIQLFTLVINISLSGQRVMPEVMNNGTIKEQMDYVTEKTRIYEDYRAIREE